MHVCNAEAQGASANPAGPQGRCVLRELCFLDNVDPTASACVGWPIPCPRSGPLGTPSALLTSGSLDELPSPEVDPPEL